jgi:hypothetical protein
VDDGVHVRVTARCGTGVVHETLATAVREIIDRTTLYDYAAAILPLRSFAGRGPAYAITLGGIPVIIRHSRHGGLLAAVTGDRFWGATRAPRELAISERLRAAGVATPQVLGYVTYPAGPGLRRADVITREVPNGRTLATILREGVAPDVRRILSDATRALVRTLSDAGSVHPDLNLANVLIAPAGDGGLRAYALDVDRVIFRASREDATRANLRRLRASAEKLGVEWDT